MTLHCSAVQYHTMQYSTVQYSTVRYSTVQYHTMQYSTVRYGTVQYSTVHYVTEHTDIYMNTYGCTSNMRCCTAESRHADLKRRLVEAFQETMHDEVRHDAQHKLP